jgi:hypothetical protein
LHLNQRPAFSFLLRKELFRDAIEVLKEDKIKKGENKYFITIA